MFMLLVGLNCRSIMLVVSDRQGQLHLTHFVAGLLASLPMLLFGLVAIFSATLRPRLGAVRWDAYASPSAAFSAIGAASMLTPALALATPISLEHQGLPR